MNNPSLRKRFRSLLLTGVIFVAGMCCGISLVITVSAPTPTPTPMVLQFVTQSATPTSTVLPTLTPTSTPTRTVTNTPSRTPTITLSPTITKRAPPPTNTPRNRPLTTQTPQVDGTVTEFGVYEEQIKQALTVFASKREIISVKVEDGRTNGGERVIMITYRTIEDNVEARAKELLDIFVVVGGSLQAYQQDVDSVTLIVHDREDNAIAISTLSKKDLVGYHDGEITMQQLIDRIKIENLAK